MNEIEKRELLIKLRQNSIYQKALNELITNSKDFECGNNFYYMQELIDKYLLLRYETDKQKEKENEIH